MRLRVEREHRIEEPGETCAALGRDPDRQPRHRGEHRERPERERHHRRRLVEVVRSLLGHARSAVEREEEQTRRVERGQERAQQEQAPDRPVTAVERGGEDLVLREEARESRHSGEPEGSDRRRDRRGHHP